MRYRLDVVGSRVDEVVCRAGGWLVDQVWAGWEVTILIVGDEDVRPLRILGVGTADRETAMLLWDKPNHPHAVAVMADVLVGDTRVREALIGAAEFRPIEVTLWGSDLPDEFDGVVVRAQHEPSAAAVAFKMQALTAAGISAPVSRTEAFGHRTVSRRPEIANVLSLYRIRHQGLPQDLPTTK